MTWIGKRSCLPLLLVFTIGTFALPARAQVGNGDPLPLRTPHHASPARLSVSAASPSDTTYVGFTPGHSADNYWSIWSGTGAENFHRPPAQNGMWGFEGPYADVHQDSLQGWWPYRLEMTGTGGLTLPDYQRPWSSLDFGNAANYVGNFGPGPDGRKRTFGVIGAWHVDGGNTVAAPAGVTWTGEPANSGGVMWAPLEGANSAWMGLRRHGDNNYLDPITGNPFNEDVLVYHIFGSAAQGGDDKKFPGYGGQMDQLLYRDVQLGSGDTSLTVSFKYRTAMSTGFSTTNSTRRGWFVHDPYTVTTGGANPNYIRNIPNGPPPPVDSLMLYAGAPAEGSVILSDGQSHTIYDPQRRWFGEVIRSNEGLYSELLTVGGTNAATTKSVTIGGATLAALKTAGGGRVRLVFRVKTNYKFDDEDFSGSGYSSGGVGAAIVDDVNLGLNGAPPAGGFAGGVQGGFNAATDIDDSPATDALHAWKSTGKPPQQYFHLHDVSTLRYDDICGPVGSADRMCDLTGVVLSIGDHDRNDETGHTDHPYEMMAFDRIISPTIQLCGPYTGPGGRNRMGLTAAQVQNASDFWDDYEIYTGAFDLLNYGNHWQPGLQSYPGGNSKTGAGEHPRWGEIRYVGYTLFQSDPQCLRDLEGSRTNGTLRTTNASGIPDSVRIVIRRMEESYRFAISNPVTDIGGYFDNLSLALIANAQAPPLQVDEWQWLQDTFPFNDSPALAGVPAAFDTTTALVKTGLNIAPLTGNSSRFDVPGDTSVVRAVGSSVRVDLVFRILPGPGNYVDASNGANSPLRATPTSTTPIPTPAAGVANFWSNYLYANGIHGTPGGHPVATSGPLAGQKVWDPNVWNSARCDTAEINQFIPAKDQHFFSGLDPSYFMSAYHEDELADPHRGALGIPRNVCFAADTSGVFPVRIICGAGPMPPGVTYPPGWATQPGSGFDGHTTTREGTKIIPDGLLTPGSHLEYFFRREDTGGGNVVLLPDTTRALQESFEGEATLDPERWKQFSVLPDRWKSPGYLHPVLGVPGSAPCMLVIDQTPGSGDMRSFAVAAEALGMTAANQRGAGTGVASPIDGDPDNPANFVRANLGQPGGTWDVYSVQAGADFTTEAGDLGSRYAFRDSTNTQIYGKRSRQGPTLAMLAAYYKSAALFTSNVGVPYGPTSNKSQDDLGLLSSWLAAGSTTTPNRGLLVQGENFMSGVASSSSSPNAAVFAANELGVALRHNYYQQLSGNPVQPIALTLGAGVSPRGDRYVLDVACPGNPDVLSFSSALAAETADGADFAPVGTGAPYLASVLKTYTAAHPWVALTNAWNLSDLHAPGGLSSQRGIVSYLADVFGGVFGSVCPQALSPTAVGGSTALAPFLRVDGNPVRAAGATHIRFALARAGRAEVRLYDVAGRMVRVLARQTFSAGEHALPWDGRDTQNRPLAHGVYFVRVEQPGSFTDVRKLVVLGP